MKKQIYLIVFFITSFALGQTKVSAPLASGVDSLLVLTPDKKINHVPFTSLRSKLEEDFDERYVDASVDIAYPLDSFFGNRVTPTNGDEGFYVESSNNNAIGYLANATGTGNATYAGFTAVINSSPFSKGGFFGILGSNYHRSWLREKTLIQATDDLVMLSTFDTGNIIFGLGNTGVNDLTETNFDKVLVLNQDREVLFPSLTNTIIENEITGQTAITLNYLNDRLSSLDFGTEGFSSTGSGATLVTKMGNTGNNDPLIWINSSETIVQADQIVFEELAGTANKVLFDLTANTGIRTFTFPTQGGQFATEAYVLANNGGGSTTTNAADLTSGVLNNARVQESNVTQHEAAISITESQISDFGTYLTQSDIVTGLPKSSDISTSRDALITDADGANIVDTSSGDITITVQPQATTAWAGDEVLLYVVDGDNSLIVNYPNGTTQTYQDEATVKLWRTAEDVWMVFDPKNETDSYTVSYYNQSTEPTGIGTQITNSLDFIANSDLALHQQIMNGTLRYWWTQI